MVNRAIFFRLWAFTAFLAIFSLFLFANFFSLAFPLCIILASQHNSVLISLMLVSFFFLFSFRLPLIFLKIWFLLFWRLGFSYSKPNQVYLVGLALRLFVFASPLKIIMRVLNLIYYAFQLSITYPLKLIRPHSSKPVAFAVSLRFLFSVTTPIPLFAQSKAFAFVPQAFFQLFRKK